MEKNKIFIGVIGGALLLAALSNAFSSEDHHSDDHMFEISYGDGDRKHGSSSRSGNNAKIMFNGKSVNCDAETGTVVLEREDGSKTTVTCD